ncbi:MAG: HD domain-containing protein [Proteobacteria bacterium]|nr:HD domain-containing protein [Pseudomonadota bacterium]MBU1689043.1 HD domain-containing protein [Pseudomonadota bacterium]
MMNMRFLKGLILLISTVILILPLYIYFYLDPSLKTFTIDGTEDEAVRVASHLASMLYGDKEISSGALPSEMAGGIEKARTDFHLLKIKIFSALGEVVYSSDKEEIGTVNRKSYFHEVVALGNNFSKVVRKDTPTMEGQIVHMDVVETYVPFMSNGKFLGAFEVYLDVSAEMASLQGMVNRLYTTTLPIVGGLFLFMILIMVKLRDGFVRRLQTERRLKENEERYRSLFTHSNDAILISDANGQIQEVNEEAGHLLGYGPEGLFGMNLPEIMNDPEGSEWPELLRQTMDQDYARFASQVKTVEGGVLDVEIRTSVVSKKSGLVQVLLRDVTEQKNNELEISRSYQTQTVLNKLLHLSLENLSLAETLELFIYYITSFPWLVLEPKGAIFLVSEKPGNLELIAHRGLNDALTTICATVPFGKCHCGKCALSGELVFSNCLDHYHDNRYDGIAPHGHYCVPIFSSGKKLVGVFTLYIKPQAKRDRLVEETLEAAASVVAGVIQRKRAEEELQKAKEVLEIRVQERTVDLEEANVQLEQELQERREAQKALAKANQDKDDLIVNLFEIMYEMLANRDHSTFEHALRVSEISRKIGLELELSEDDLEILKLGCLVHDIGKVAIPDDVLLKPGLFDRMDRSIMQVHTLVGASLFAKHHHDYRIRRIILHHHERLDGSGYPYGLKGDEIELLERIVAVADVFEALVSRRPYKRPMSRQRALDILAYEAQEGRLDPMIVEVLVKVTETWSPLEISCEFRADYSKDLEVFRQMSYFREPLSDFYNYRYLLYLDDAKMIGKNNRAYHLILTNFPEIKDFNRSMGFVKTDQILDEIGQKLHQTSEDIGLRCAKEGNNVMLLRKGSDFLIYTECSDVLLQDLLEEIGVHLDSATSDWGLQSKYHYFKFDSDYPAEKALNQIFSIH